MLSQNTTKPLLRVRKITKLKKWQNPKLLFNYFFLFWIIIFAGSATVFARSLGDIRTIGNGFALILTLIFINVNKIRFNNHYGIVICVFSGYALATFVNNHLINPFWWSQWLIWLSIAYCICQGFKNTLFKTYEDILLWLCIISIPFWLWLLFDYNSLAMFAKSIAFSEPFSKECDVKANIIVYTINSLDTTVNNFSWLKRNPGFAWEPGAFSSFICLAILCNMIRTKMRLKQNWRFWFFVFILFTTQSTTGIIIFLLMMAGVLIIKRRFGPLIISIPILILLYQLPFVKDKLLEEFTKLNEFNLADMQENKYALGRLISFKISIDEFLRHPLLGLGGYTEGTWLKQHGYDNLSVISGIGQILSMFGSIMTCVFLYCLHVSAKKISQWWHSNYGYLLWVVMLGSMFSYSLWTTPLFIAFWMFGYLCFQPLKRKKKRIRLRL